MFTPLALAFTFAATPSLSPNLPPIARAYAARSGAPDLLGAVQPARIIWKLQAWGAKGTLVQELAPGRERVEIELPTVPFDRVTHIDGGEVRERDPNGQVKVLGGISKQAAQTRLALDSGSWLTGGALVTEESPDGEGRARLLVSPQAGFPVELSFDADGTLREALWHEGGELVTREYKDHAWMGSRFVAHTVVERTSSEEGASVQRLDQINLMPSMPPFARLEPRLDVHLPPGVDRIELPLSLAQGRFILVPVTLGDRPATFLLDTGADATALDLTAAKSLGLSPTAELKQTAGLFKSVYFLRSPPLSVGGARVDPQTVIALDLSGGYFGENFPKIAGILGFDFLSRFVVAIDYPAATLTLTPRAQFKPGPDDVSIAATLDGSSLRLPVEVAGQSGQFILDTGSGGGVLVQHLPGQLALVEAAGRRLLTPGGAQFGSGQAGVWPARANVQVGPFFWWRAPIAVVDEGSAKGGSMAVAGNVGATFLRHFRVTVDLGGPRLWLAQEIPFRRGEGAATFGLGLARKAGRLLVRTLSVGGPAEKAGLQLGDEIVAINGLPAKATGRFGNVAVANASVGEGLQLSYLRAGQALEVELLAVPLP